MARCIDCTRIADNLGRQTPRGWRPFGWGPSTEDPEHFHIMPEDATEPPPDTPWGVLTTKLCNLDNLERR